MENKLPETVNPASGDFHTHSNLVQTLNGIVHEHFKSVNATEDNPQPKFPHFIAEAIHMILSNLAAGVNGNLYHKEHWENISTYSQLATGIVEKMEKQQQLKLEELKRNTVKELQESLTKDKDTNEK